MGTSRGERGGGGENFQQEIRNKNTNTHQIKDQKSPEPNRSKTDWTASFQRRQPPAIQTR